MHQRCLISYLRDKAIEIGVRGTLDIKRPPADVVDGLIVEQHRHIGVLKQRMGRENTVVRLHNRSRNLRRRVHSETQLGFLSIIDRKPLQKQRPETRPGTATNGIEDQEPLKPGTVISELPDAVQAEIDDLLADGVVAAGEVVGCVLLAGDELLGVEELAVGAGADLVDDGGLQIDEDGARDVLASAGLGEEGVEGVVAAADGLVAGHLAIGANAVLEAVELPAGVAHLDTGLTDVD